MGNSQTAAPGCSKSGFKPCQPCDARTTELRFDKEAGTAAKEDEVVLAGRAEGFAEICAAELFRAKVAAQHPQDILPPSPYLEGLNPAATEDQLGWAAFVAEIMWPYVRKAAMKKCAHIFKEKINEEIAKHPEIKLKELKLDFDPGHIPPRVHAIRVYERSQQDQQSMQIDADISWYPDAGFHVSLSVIGRAKHFPIKAENIGISDISLRGTMSCLLAPLLECEPCVGTGQAFFLDMPAIQFRLDGVKRMGPIGRVITTLMEGAVNQVLVDGFILPNRFVQCIEKNLSLETQICMKSPLPIGVLRVEVLEGKNLPGADVNLLTGKRTSDAFVQVRVGFDKIRTSTIADTCDPLWKDLPGHLFVYNVDQIVRMTVQDDDVMGADDLLGEIIGYNVYLLCKECAGKPDGAWLDVIDPKGTQSGQVRIRCTYFGVGEIGKNPAPSQPDSPFLPPYIVSVKLLGLDGPDNEDMTGARVTAEILGDDGATEDHREKHHANRLMDGLDAAAHFAKTKAHATRQFGFGKPESGAPMKRKSGKAVTWGAERVVVDSTHSAVVSPMTIRAMESLVMSEGWSTDAVAEMFGVHEETVKMLVALRSNFEVVFGEALHFVQPASKETISGKMKLSVEVPSKNKVRGADEQGLLGGFILDLPPDPTWGKPWSQRIRKNLTTTKTKPSKANDDAEVKPQSAEEGSREAEPTTRVSTDSGLSGGMLRTGIKKLRSSVISALPHAAPEMPHATLNFSGTEEEVYEESSTITLEVVMEIRRLLPVTCMLSPGQTCRGTEQLKEATRDSGVKITSA